MTGLAGLAVAVGDQLDSRGSALLWSWPPGACCGLLTGGRSPWGNRCSVGGDRLACPKVTPTAAPCRPPRPLAARRRALTCRPRCWPGAALGGARLDHRDPRWSGRSATMRSAASRSALFRSGCQGPGGEQPPGLRWPPRVPASGRVRSSWIAGCGSARRPLPRVPRPCPTPPWRWVLTAGMARNPGAQSFRPGAEGLALGALTRACTA
jgi:hypothetical protein